MLATDIIISLRLYYSEAMVLISLAYNKFKVVL